MRLFDTSFYYKDDPADNYIVEILPVNKSVWVPFRVSKGFSLVLNSSNLQYRKASDETCLIDLPDGIYEIKQSVKPNVITLNHFYHFRTISLSNDVREEKVKLSDEKCDISKADYIKQRDKLRDIDEYIESAKWMVEEHHDKIRGKEMYEYAQKLLEQYTNECQC